MLKMLTGCLSIVVSLGLVSEVVNAASDPELYFGMPDRVDEREARYHDERVVRFSHADVPAWKSVGAKRHTFEVVPPRDEKPGMPLLVILHSVGAVELGDRHHPFSPYAGLEDWGYRLILHQTRGGPGWWGAEGIGADADRYRDEFEPNEKRILSTIEWVIRKYRVDRDRVYLSGVSMGGSGVLGNGMGRGDIFAAVRAIVPAGHRHMAHRLEGPDVPDPPVLIYAFSQADVWARGYESEYRKLVQRHRLGTFETWGPLGHKYYPCLYHPAVTSIDWLSIRRDEAYPVLINASADDVYPVHGKRKGDPLGQRNGFVRYRVVRDTAGAFEMRFWLLGADELASAKARAREHRELVRQWCDQNHTRNREAAHLRPLVKKMIEDLAQSDPVAAPLRTEVDVALRRLQHLDRGRPLRWRFERDGKAVQEGTAKWVDGLLEIGRLTVLPESGTLIVEPAGP